MRTISDSFRRQKPLVQALIAMTVLTGAVLFALGISEHEVRLRETGVMLSIVLPVIGLLEDRIYRKSRERYLETQAAAERQKLGLPPITAPLPTVPTAAATVLAQLPAIATVSQPSPWARPTSASASPKTDTSAIDWYGLYG